MKHKKSEKPKKHPEPKQNELDKLCQQIDNLQKEKDELFEKLQRVSADYTNFQKRVPKQIADTICYEEEKIIKTLLPVLDNFEHILQNAHSAENADVLVKGVRIIYDQMLDILKSHGIEQIKALGQKFDPALHEAMMKKTKPDTEENIVLEEFQKGYKLNGRVIRPTKAVVSALPAEQNEQQEQTTDESQTSDAE
jgi:molecular chaperone GrpE